MHPGGRAAGFRDAVRTELNIALAPVSMASPLGACRAGEDPLAAWQPKSISPVKPVDHRRGASPVAGGEEAISESKPNARLSRVPAEARIAHPLSAKGFGVH